MQWATAWLRLEVDVVDVSADELRAVRERDVLLLGEEMPVLVASASRRFAVTVEASDDSLRVHVRERLPSRSDHGVSVNLSRRLYDARELPELVAGAVIGFPPSGLLLTLGDEPFASGSIVEVDRLRGVRIDRLLRR